MDITVLIISLALCLVSGYVSGVKDERARWMRGDERDEL